MRGVTRGRICLALAAQETQQQQCLKQGLTLPKQMSVINAMMEAALPNA